MWLDACLETLKNNGTIKHVEVKEISTEDFSIDKSAEKTEKTKDDTSKEEFD